MQQLHASPPHSDRAADALAPNGEWNNYIRTIVGFISGGNLDQLSVADYLAYDEASSDNNWRTPTGLGSLVARSFPAKVELRLATSADSIALESKGVTVRTPAGDIRARAALLTVSTAVLAGDVSEASPLSSRPGARPRASCRWATTKSCSSASTAAHLKGKRSC